MENRELGMENEAVLTTYSSIAVDSDFTYPNGAEASQKLNWSYYVELLKTIDPVERSFYERQAMCERWQ